MNRHYPAYTQRVDITELHDKFCAKLKSEYEALRVVAPTTKVKNFYASVAAQDQAFFELADQGDPAVLRRNLERAIENAMYTTGFAETISVGLVIDNQVWLT